MNRPQYEQSLQQLEILALNLDSYLQVLHKAISFDSQNHDVCTDYLDFIEDIRKQISAIHEQIEELKNAKPSKKSFPKALVLFPVEE